MPKLTIKIAFPIILAGVFAIIIFLAMDYEQLQPSFYIIFFFFVVYIFSFGLATGQSLTTPVKKLLKNAKELSEGNLSSRVYLESKDEFSELAKAFNKIAENLEESQLQEKNTEKVVSIKVKARTKDLEEMIGALEQKVKNRTIELERMMEKLDRLQEELRNKEAETTQLRNELDELSKKVG